jgi:hypothetical protein
MQQSKFPIRKLSDVASINANAPAENVDLHAAHNQNPRSRISSPCEHRRATLPTRQKKASPDANLISICPTTSTGTPLSRIGL